MAGDNGDAVQPEEIKNAKPQVVAKQPLPVELPQQVQQWMVYPIPKVMLLPDDGPMLSDAVVKVLLALADDFEAKSHRLHAAVFRPSSLPKCVLDHIKRCFRSSQTMALLKIVGNVVKELREMGKIIEGSKKADFQGTQVAQQFNRISAKYGAMIACAESLLNVFNYGVHEVEYLYVKGLPQPPRYVKLVPLPGQKIKYEYTAICKSTSVDNLIEWIWLGLAQAEKTHVTIPPMAFPRNRPSEDGTKRPEVEFRLFDLYFATKVMPNSDELLRGYLALGCKLKLEESLASVINIPDAKGSRELKDELAEFVSKTLIPACEGFGENIMQAQPYVEFVMTNDFAALGESQQVGVVHSVRRRGIACNKTDDVRAFAYVMETLVFFEGMLERVPFDSLPQEDVDKVGRLVESTRLLPSFVFYVARCLRDSKVTNGTLVTLSFEKFLDRLYEFESKVYDVMCWWLNCIESKPVSYPILWERLGKARKLMSILLAIKGPPQKPTTRVGELKGDEIKTYLDVGVIESFARRFVLEMGFTLDE